MVMKRGAMKKDIVNIGLINKEMIIGLICAAALILIIIAGVYVYKAGRGEIFYSPAEEALKKCPAEACASGYQCVEGNCIQCGGDSIFPAIGQSTLEEYGNKRGVLIGLYDGTKGGFNSYDDIIINESSATFDNNALGWISTGLNQYDFSMISRAKSTYSGKGVSLFGGALVWNDADAPRWLNFYNVTTEKSTSDCGGWYPADAGQREAKKNELKGILKNYIAAAIKNGSTDYYAWQIVNEPRFYRSNSCWARIFGKNEYINLSFSYAKEAANQFNPKLILMMNDYFYNTADIDEFFGFVGELRANGTPIDAVGSHMHISSMYNNVYTSDQYNNDLRYFLERAKSVGLTAFITEFDVVLPAPPLLDTDKFRNGWYSDEFILTNGFSLNFDRVNKSSNLIVIGASANTTRAQNYFMGSIDDAKIYGRALSNTEVTGIYFGDDINNGLISGWAFDETSYPGTNGDVKDVKGINNGTSKNGLSSTIGNTGNAGRFDGINDYVLIGNPDSLNSNFQQLSVSAWIKRESVGNPWQRIIAKYYYEPGKESGSWYILLGDKNNSACTFNINGAWVGASSNINAVPVDNRWHLVTCVFNGNSLINYVDAVEQTRTNISTTTYIGVPDGYGSISCNNVNANTPKARIQLNIPYNGSYIIKALTAGNGASHNNFCIQVDNGAIESWDVSIATNFVWKEFNTQSYKRDMFIGAGNHNISFYLGEDGTKLSRLKIGATRVDYYNESNLNKQKEIYKKVVDSCLDYSNCKMFMTWGVSDLNSWLTGYSFVKGDMFFPNARPLIFDENFARKPAYEGVMEALKENEVRRCSIGGDGGTPGGGGGGGDITSCTPTWRCDWSACIRGSQTYVCVKNNTCQRNVGKPLNQTRECSSDGGGFVPDDTSTDQTDQQPMPGESEESLLSRYSWAIIAGFVALILAVLAAIIILMIKRRRKSELQNIINEPENKDIDKFAAARAFIAKVKVRGYSPDEIKEMFRSKGWNDFDIDKLDI